MYESAEALICGLLGPGKPCRVAGIDTTILQTLKILIFPIAWYPKFLGLPAPISFALLPLPDRAFPLPLPLWADQNVLSTVSPYPKTLGDGETMV